jgi:general secretion pathway protein D
MTTKVRSLSTQHRDTVRRRLLAIGHSLRPAMLCCCVAVLAACAGSSKPAHPAKPEASAPVQRVSMPQPATVQQRQPILIPGTGQFFGNPPPAPTLATPAEGYQLSFVDTEIASVVASVIGDGLGLPYVVDPQVKGTMTLQASRPLAREDVLPSLEAALNMRGVALVNANGVYQAVPSKDASRRITGLRGESQRGAGYSIQIAPLRYISAAEMEKALRPFAPDGGILRVDEARNLLLLAGSSRELSVMLDVVQTFDVDWLAGMSFGLFPVEYVDAKTLADELGNIFADSKSPIGNVVRLVPLNRLNSLMVVTHEPSYLKQVETWIKRLDIGVSAPGRRIYVYDVQNGKADDLAASLSKILSIAGGGSQVNDRTQSRGSAFNSSSVMGNSGGGLGGGMGGGAAGGLGGNLGAGLGGTLQSSSGAGLSSVTTQSRSGDYDSLDSASRGGGAAGAMKIVPNIENNSLLIYATPNEFASLESALKRLDVVPIQVLIEASLAEVTLTDDMKFGVQWSYQAGEGPLVLSDASNGGIGSQFPGFSFLFNSRTNIRAVLNALESMTDVNVLSSPKLLVLNNREAELQIGDQVPITVQSSISTVGEAAPIVNAVQLRDTGVILRITPRVNKSGLVLLDVAQEVSDVVPTTSSSIDSPTIQQRRIASTVAVHDGETIALGGLIRDSTTRSRGGIPYLRKIPLVGELFGSTGKNNRRTELIVLITPRVIRSSQEAESLMDELHDQFRGLRNVLSDWHPGKSDAPAEGDTKTKHEAAPAAAPTP